jgi:peptidoglycan-N-acetylglucosamine deacetylase
MFYYLIIIVLLSLLLISNLPFKTPFDSKDSIWELISNNIFLTFDDGPNRKITPFILDQLKKYNFKATFFLIPEYVTADNEFLVKRLVQEGHTIGLHGKSRWLSFKSHQYLNMYIKTFNERLSILLNKEFKVKYFRPPSLWRSLWLRKTLEDQGVNLVGVSPFCWLDQYTTDSNLILKRFEKYLRQGRVYILHEGIAKSFEPEMPQIIEVLPKILKYLSDNNVESSSLH